MRLPRSLIALVALSLAGIALAVSRDGDGTGDAVAGDCLATSADVRPDEDTEAEAQVVGCSQAAATFAVVGRVDGRGDARACETFFVPDEEYFVYRSTAGDGYLLCLRRAG